MYCFIKESDVTQEMLNYSVNANINDARRVLVDDSFLYIFPTTNTYLVIEFDPLKPECKTIFKDYRMFTSVEAISILNSENAIKAEDIR